MGIITGAQAPGIFVGREDLGIHLRAADAGIIVGSGDGGIHVGVGPKAAVLDGITSHITIDGLAPVAYTEVGDVHLVMLYKDTYTKENYLTAVGNNDPTLLPAHHLMRVSNDVGEEGRLQPSVANQTTAVATMVGSAATQVADGVWHLVQVLDWDVSGTGTIYAQVDGATRENTDSYTRFPVDSTYPKFFTLAAIRRNATPDISLLAVGTMGYFALITGEQLSQASMAAIWAAFDTGGGRRNTRRLSDAIAAQLTTGTLRWAGPLDGTDPHYNPDSVAAPIHVDTVIVDADY